MYLTQKLNKNIERICIDLMGGKVSIKTHSGNDLILDARKMRYAGLIPQMEIADDVAYIHKQASTAFFPPQEDIIFKILVPEKKLLGLKMFVGEFNITGIYNTLNVKVRTGNVTIEGPYFSIENNSHINVINGNIMHRKLSDAGFVFEKTVDMETIALLNNARLTSKVFLGEIPYL